MAAIDLRTINFRANERSSESEDVKLTPLAGSSTIPLSLAAIKFRAKENGGEED